MSNSRRIGKKIPAILGIVYMCVLLYVLFFKRIRGTTALSYAEYLRAFCNFIPFKSIYVFLTTPVISKHIVLEFAFNFFGNIALFIPWGILLPLNYKKTTAFMSFMIITIIAIIMIEAIQLFTMIGSFDIEDILLNLLGSCIGFAFFARCIKNKITY